MPLLNKQFKHANGRTEDETFVQLTWCDAKELQHSMRLVHPHDVHLVRMLLKEANYTEVKP